MDTVLLGRSLNLQVKASTEAVKMNLLAIVIAVCLEVERKHRIKLSGFENERSRILAKNILLAQLPCCRIGEATGAWEDANAWRREERMRHI